MAQKTDAVQDFYPRPLRGGRRVKRSNKQTEEHFYPRPLRGGRHCRPLGLSVRQEFLSTPSARRATIKARKRLIKKLISIHALCEEGDPIPPNNRFHTCEFLSTPSARRATMLRHYFRDSQFISIHALCEEGDLPSC